MDILKFGQFPQCWYVNQCYINSVSEQNNWSKNAIQTQQEDHTFPTLYLTAVNCCQSHFHWLWQLLLINIHMNGLTNTRAGQKRIDKHHARIVITLGIFDGNSEWKIQRNFWYTGQPWCNTIVIVSFCKLWKLLL